MKVREIGFYGVFLLLTYNFARAEELETRTSSKNLGFIKNTNYIVGAFGGFKYAETQAGFEETWGDKQGYVVGGWIGRAVSRGRLICLEFTESLDSAYPMAYGGSVKMQSATLGIMTSLRIGFSDFDRSFYPYLITGIGLSHLQEETITFFFGQTISWDFAYQLGTGLQLAEFLGLEGIYFSGQRNGNTQYRLNVIVILKI